MTEDQKIVETGKALRPGGHPAGDEWPRGAIEAYDDGMAVYLDAYSGGASKEGAWGMVRLRVSRPGQPDEVWTYDRVHREPITSMISPAAPD